MKVRVPTTEPPEYAGAIGRGCRLISAGSRIRRRRLHNGGVGIGRMGGAGRRMTSEVKQPAENHQSDYNFQRIVKFHGCASPNNQDDRADSTVDMVRQSKAHYRGRGC